MLSGMAEFCEEIKNSNIIVTYNGPLWGDVIEGLAGTLKKRLVFDELPLSVSQCIFSVFIEQLNNVLMYSAEKETNEKREDKHSEASIGTAILGIADNAYFIQTVNLMKNENSDYLKSMIDYVNTLDKIELRKYYREQIKLENTNPKSKGAGLGIIEIARRASSKIEYLFTPFNKEFSLFTMYVGVGGGK